MRRATIRTKHDDPEAIARAILPDNTDEMTTAVEDNEGRRPSSDRTESDDGVVVTRIERETTGGLHSTVDDYVVNVDVATAVVRHARDAKAQHARQANRPADANASANRPAEADASAMRATDASASDANDTDETRDTNDE